MGLLSRWFAGLMGLALVGPALAAEPQVGHSLFQAALTTADGRTDIPFPFERLLSRLKAQVLPGTSLREGVPLVLIPLGRSLQRHAAEDAGYFTYPRVVVAVTGEPRPGALFLKDRLYIGYHQGLGVLEVISYNDAAGRFEFQLVRDYRPGGQPTLEQARRELCVACHHDGTPIFSRQTWDETSANPNLARLLEAHLSPALRVLPWRGGVDIPNAIDDATERSNRLDFAQRLWREGCGAPSPAATACRGELLVQALLQRLGLPEDSPAGALDPLAPLRQRWPEGLPLANPDIPNRLPLAPLDPQSQVRPTGAQLRRVADVAAAFDPLAPRPVRDRWDGRAPSAVGEAAGAVGQLLAGSDVAAVGRQLAKPVGPGGVAQASRLRQAVARMGATQEGGLDSGPFVRSAVVTALLRQLGVASPNCCAGKAAWPAVVESPRPAPPAGTGPEMAILYRSCGACHGSADPFPPGFLHGGGAAVARQVAACAPRMVYRLAMGALAPERRPKTPMPPVFSAHGPGFASSPEFRGLMPWLEAQAGSRSEFLLQQTYADLPPCRPAFD